LTTAGADFAMLEDADLTGAFVARLWSDAQGLRARVRYTVDLAAPEIEATLRGTPEHVVSELTARFSQWAEDFAGRAAPPDTPDRGPVTDE